MALKKHVGIVERAESGAIAPGWLPLKRTTGHTSIPKPTPQQRFHQELAAVKTALHLLIEQVEHLERRNYEDLPDKEEFRDIDKAFPKDF